MAKKRSNKPKRANGEGSVFPLPNGKWRATITIGWTADGKRVRRSKTGDSQADARAFLRELQAEAHVGEPASPNKTLADHLRNWLLGVELSQEENTALSYRLACDKHIIPLIGRTKLKEVKPATVRWMLAEMVKLEAGGRTVENAFVVLRTALGVAVTDGDIPSNPCSSVQKPRHDPKEIYPFTLEESKAILKATESHRLHGLFVLAFATGMRSGELFGLEWRDLDFEAGTVHVQRQATEMSNRVLVKPPKSKAGNRKIELSPGTLAALKDRQRLMLKEGQVGNPLVFPNRRGDHIRRGTLRSKIWNPLLKRLKLEPRGFHHVRHTYACLSLADGVPLPTVSQILGHSKQETTLRFYSRRLPGHQKAATDSVTRLFG